ncbi:MAG: hypothetical protein RJS97_00500 [Parvibaculaceae bacterium]
MSEFLPEHVETHLARNPAHWAVMVALVARLGIAKDLQMTAGMSAAPIGKVSFPSLEFEFRGGHVLAFRIEIPDDILIRFMTVRDRVLFETLIDSNGASPDAADLDARDSSSFGRDREITIRCDGADVPAIADALMEVASRTTMRQLIPRPDDTQLQTLLRRLYSASDACFLEALSADIVTSITAESIDHTLDLVARINPWAGEDPQSVPDTVLMLLEALVRERRKYLPQARAHLLRIRQAFEAIGKTAAEDVQDVDELLGLLKKNAH